MSLSGMKVSTKWFENEPFVSVSEFDSLYEKVESGCEEYEGRLSRRYRSPFLDLPTAEVLRYIRVSSLINISRV